ncbi:hypothetical protein PGT21_034651 [Puccinia graminis f. sp. tritici]|uniref:Uncharacterized protein n=1 Tax=Puccinia graminis f. sp. tritici TaxID=56615 RepID=A0A5B0MFD6_PUCGR|nr:hypothetical protein PGT21_034651 [Puccinia graminis f. sp. tritici]
MKKTIPITSFFSKRPAESQAEKPATKFTIQEVACVGNNDDSWPRPRGNKKIIECIQNSPSVYHGGPPRYKLCEKLFGKKREAELSEVEKQLLQEAVVREATWEIRRNDGCRSIHSTKCTRSIPSKPSPHLSVCNECLNVRKDKSLLTAINTKYANDENLKYVRKSFMASDPFQEKRRTFEQVHLLATRLERATKKDDQMFWKAFAAQAEAGKFNDLEPFKGLVMAVAIRNERESSGKALTGIRFSPSFDDFMMTMAATSPRCAQLFRETFAGRSLRSQRDIRAKNSVQLADGLALVNFQPVSSILKDLDYSGPLAVGSDQTVCLKSLRAHDGYLVGAQGGDIKFNSEEHLKTLTQKIIVDKSFCSKLRAYTIQVPLPGIPTYVVALLASKDKECATDIIETHKQVLDLCDQVGLKVLSISSDGAANELSAQMEVVKLSDSHLKFIRPKHKIDIQIPLVGSPPLPLVAIQDPKHARKTSTNQLLSGARLLCFGKYWFSILHLSVIVESDGASIYPKDVFNCDKQDDGRAY